jgi:hypothetical protein
VLRWFQAIGNRRQLTRIATKVPLEEVADGRRLVAGQPVDLVEKPLESLCECRRVESVARKIAGGGPPRSRWRG